MKINPITNFYISTMKTKSIFKLSLFLLLVSLFSISCSKDDETKVTGTFSCKIDGELFTGTTFTNTLIGDETAKRIDIRAKNEVGEQLVITINDLTGIEEDFSHLGTKVYTDATANSPLGIITLGTFYDTDNSYYTTSSSDDEGYAMLTAYDLEGLTVSGEFEFTLASYSGGEDMEVTEGVFANQVFTSY